MRRFEQALLRRVTLLGTLTWACASQEFTLTRGKTPTATETATATRATPNANPSATSSSANDAASELLKQDRIELEPALSFRADGQLTPSARAELAQVARLLTVRQDFLLIRIQVARACHGSDQARRELMLAAQVRADAILQYLWRSGRISAERLEAVGAPPLCTAASQRDAPTKSAWHTELWIQQRAKSRTR